MKIGFPCESDPLESRVAATPETVSKLIQAGHEVLVGEGAGVRSGWADQSYTSVGAVVRPNREIFFAADIIAKVACPTEAEIQSYRSGALVLCFFTQNGMSSQGQKIAQLLGEKNVSLLAMENVPRSTRAQRIDALSTMSTVAGYKAVLMAANECHRFFPMLTTAVGSIPPAKVLVIGAGVAGLQAIATAKRLGGVVTAFDTRQVAEEQVKSVGGKFVSLEVPKDQAEDHNGYGKELSAEFYAREQQMIRRYSKDADVIISTAQIRGRRAPILFTEEMVREMKPGSVIIDLAAETGGNCVLTQLGNKVEVGGVKIIGPQNITSTLPGHASLLYSKNILSLIELLCPKGVLELNLQDDIIESCLTIHKGKLLHTLPSGVEQAPATTPATELKSSHGN